MQPIANHGRGETPRVAIVMPIRDEAGHIERALDAIDAQSYPADRIEILVVDGGSTDGTLELLRDRASRDERITLLGEPGMNTPLAMNVGIEAATAPFVAKIDGHGWINEDYLEEAVQELTSDPALGCVGGRIVPEAATQVERAIAYARFSVLGVGGGVYTLDDRRQLTDTVQCGVYRKQALVEAGGFDSMLPYGEDEEANHRLRARGWRILMNPRIQFTYRVRPSIGSLFRQYVRYGRARVAVLRKHRQFFRWKHVIPAVLVLTLLGSLGIATVSPMRGVALLPWALYGFILILGAGALAVRHRFGRPDLILASLVALHIGYGLGTLRGLFDGRRRPA